MIFNLTLIVAIIVPNNPKLFKIVAKHKDSPVLKIRPSALKIGSRKCSDACLLHNEIEVLDETNNFNNHNLDETEKNLINTDQISNCKMTVKQLNIQQFLFLHMVVVCGILGLTDHL
ncbi:hypothetical protein COBT_003635, partial [Conglomerata obtusa]